MMRPTHTIEEILGSRSRISVLRALWRATIPLNASQIAARTGLTRPAVTSALGTLASAGLVRSSSAGKANVHLLARENIYVEQYVAPIFEAEVELPGALESELRTAFEDLAESAVLFGSYARGDQQSNSDVDLILVATDAESKHVLDDRSFGFESDFHRRWGAPLSALTYEAREANALWRKAPEFAESLRDDAVVVFGKGPWEWTDDE